MNPIRRVASALGLTTLVLLATWVVSGGSGAVSPEGDLPPSESLNGPYCGIYSLYHALRAVDVPVQFDSLTQERYVGSGNGSSAGELRQAALDHGAEAMVLDGMTVSTLRFATNPLILHVREPSHGSAYNHWVLFLGCDGDKARIIDGRNHVSIVTVAELLALWDGNGVLITRQSRGWNLAYSDWIDAALILVAGVLGVVGAVVVAGSPTTHEIRTGSLVQIIGQLGAFFVLAAMLGTAWHLIRSEGYYINRLAIGLVAEHQLTPEVSFVSSENLAAMIKTGEVTVVDARIPADYQAGHIPGAMNIPISTGWLAKRELLIGVPVDRTVVVYCQSDSCRWSDTIAGTLISRGCTGVVIYRGGYQEWKRHGRATEPN